MEIKRFNCRAGEEDLGAVALVLDLAKAFERASLRVVRAWATHFGFPRKVLRVLCAATLSTRGECNSLDVWRSRSGPSRLSCQGQSGVACFCVLCCKTHSVRLQKINPSLKLRVFVDDITALLMVKNKEVAEMAKKKVMKKLKDEVEKKGLKCRSLRTERKERAR